MTTFAQAVITTPGVSYTTNGMQALNHAGNALVDLFYKIGASRGKSVIAEFERAFQDDAILAMKIALWARDVRGGAGERQIFRDILLHLEIHHQYTLEKVLPFVSEFGRWDDLLIFKTEKFKNLAYTLIGDALRAGNGLAAKWVPRKGPVALEIRKFFNMTPKQYRKSLVALTNVVETKMCAKQWDQIDFGKLPSLASARYNKAFAKNAADSYAKYKERLQNGTDKVNAAAVYPYDVIKTLRFGGDAVVADAQWNALPDYMDGSAIMPLVDVSGSMHCPVGGNKNLMCIDIALSLGLYCADKNKGVFKDTFLTFSGAPEAQVVKGSLSQKMVQMNSSKWGMNTNLHAALEEILRIAVKGNVADADMPKTLLILSDMQFDACVTYNNTALKMIKQKYNLAGYTVPNVVFWNLNSHSNVPVKFNEQGTALVSGFSPAVMKGILNGSDMTPYGIMMSTIDVPRYSVL